jgi:hypothetical protein
MSHENSSQTLDLVTWAMVRAPRFNPEDGRTQEYVFKELRSRLASMQGEWWGGEELYRRMGEFIDQAEEHLNAGNVTEAKRAFGEVYAIIDQTPRPKKVKPA